MQQGVINATVHGLQSLRPGVLYPRGWTVPSIEHSHSTLPNFCLLEKYTQYPSKNPRVWVFSVECRGNDGQTTREEGSRWMESLGRHIEKLGFWARLCQQQQKSITGQGKAGHLDRRKNLSRVTKWKQISCVQEKKMTNFTWLQQRFSRTMVMAKSITKLFGRRWGWGFIYSIIQSTYLLSISSAQVTVLACWRKAK